MISGLKIIQFNAFLTRIYDHKEMAAHEAIFAACHGVFDATYFLLMIVDKKSIIFLFSSSVAFPSINMIANNHILAATTFSLNIASCSTFHWLFLCQYPIIIPSGTYAATKIIAKVQILNIELIAGILSIKREYWMVTKLANVIINTRYML
jgi:hypothetical protein